MKKNLCIGLAALAALTLSSCQREAEFNIGPKMVTVTLTADKAGDETRAAANEGTDKVTYTWTDEDITNLKLFKVTTTTTTGDDGKETTVETIEAINGVTTSVSDDNRVLSITATVEANSTLRAIVTSDWTTSETDPKPRMALTQSPAADNFDPNADILISDDVTVSELNAAKLNFVRPVTVNKMTLKGLTSGETVSKITLTSDKNITGYCKYDEDRTMQGQRKEVTILYENATVGSNGEFPVYFVAMPGEGHTLTLAVETVKSSKDWRYAKTLSKTVKFTKGKFSKFSVDLTGCGQAVVDVDYSGEWVIGGTDGTTGLAATSFSSGNFYPVGEVTIAGDVVTVPSSPESYKMTITRITSGDNAGLYTIVDAGGKYLTAKTSGNNMEGLATPSDNSYWSIAENADGTHTVLAAKVTGDLAKLMCVNFGSPRVSCYKENTTQKKVTLYPYDKVTVAAPPTTGYQFQKVSAVTSGKQYLIVANDGSKLLAAKPVPASNDYGYPAVAEVTDVSGVITLSSMDNAFTFESASNGFTIKQSDNRYWWVDASHTSFQVSASPSEGQYFSFAKNNDGTFTITNILRNKFVQYSKGHTSYGCYASAQSDGFYPYLYEYIGEGGNTPTTYSITIASGIQNGTVTASMTSNIEAGESITITVAPATGYELETLTVDGANVTSEVVDNQYNFDMPDHDVAVSASFKSAATVTYDFTTVAELNALVTTTSATYNGKFTNAVISFVPATNTAIIKDATGSITYYKSSHGLKQGQTFSGDITVTAVNFTGNNGTAPLYSEITDLGSAKFSGAEAVVAPEDVTLSALIGHYSDYQNAYVKVSDLTVVSKSSKNITVSDGTNTYIVYDNTNGISCKANDKITAAGTVTKYGTTEEIKVWAATDATVTSTGTGGGDVYTLYSGAWTEGDYLITYSNRAMNTEIANNRLQFVTVAPADNKVTSSDATIVWHIAKSGNYWTIYNAEAQKYAAGNGTKNQAALNASGTDDGSLWTVTVTDDGTYEFVNKKNAAASVNCNLRNNGTYGFACYGTATGGALTLYKLN